MTTVTDMIEALSKFPPHAKILVSKDAEGVSFRDADLAEFPYYVEPSENGEYDLVLSQSDYEEDDDYDGLEEAVVIWPS